MPSMILKTILSWVVGVAICILIMMITTQLNSERSILLWGYGSLASLSFFVWQIFNQIRKKEMELIDKKLEQKADVKDIQRVEEQLKQVSTNQEEAHATMENIYNILLEWKTKN